MHQILKIALMYANIINDEETNKLFLINNCLTNKNCCKMSKNHDENKDLRLLSRVCKIDYSNKTIQAPKTAVIGIRSWGRIDYLCHYCGWYFIWNNEVSVRVSQTDIDNSNKSRRNAKKAAKEQTLTNKKKK